MTLPHTNTVVVMVPLLLMVVVVTIKLTAEKSICFAADVYMVYSLTYLVKHSTHTSLLLACLSSLPYTLRILYMCKVPFSHLCGGFFLNLVYVCVCAFYTYMNVHIWHKLTTHIYSIHRRIIQFKNIFWKHFFRFSFTGDSDVWAHILVCPDH